MQPSNPEAAMYLALPADARVQWLFSVQAQQLHGGNTHACTQSVCMPDKTESLRQQRL